MDSNGDAITGETYDTSHDPATSGNRRTAITARNAQMSPLLRLPGEPRNRIYDYLYKGHVHDILFLPITPGSEEHRYALKSSSRHHLALSSVCRELHDETSNLPFKRSAFLFRTFFPLLMIESAYNYNQCKLITEVHLEVHLYKSCMLEYFLTEPVLGQYSGRPKGQLYNLFPQVQSVVVCVPKDAWGLNSTPAAQENRVKLERWLGTCSKRKISVEFRDEWET